MAFAVNITKIIGRTPLVRINRVAGEQCVTLTKYETSNPGGSVKDHPALAITRAAQASGALKPGGTIVEATSGNTGVSLAMVGTALGYQIIIVMSSSMSIERRKLMAAFGAKLLLTTPADGVQGVKAATEKYLANHPSSVYATQFDNPTNPDSHYRITRPEIWEQTEGKVDVLVTGVGSAGTITGVGRFLKGHNPQVQVVAMKPAESPFLATDSAGSHKTQGIGASLIPGDFGRAVVDEFLTITSDKAIETARRAAAQEGLLVGISSDVNLAATAVLVARPEDAGKTIVTVLPDTDERYLSTVLFEGVGEVGEQFRRVNSQAKQ